jgi:hypothetical protein
MCMSASMLHPCFKLHSMFPGERRMIIMIVLLPPCVRLGGPQAGGGSVIQVDSARRGAAGGRDSGSVTAAATSHRVPGRRPWAARPRAGPCRSSLRVSHAGPSHGGPGRGMKQAMITGSLPVSLGRHGFTETPPAAAGPDSESGEPGMPVHWPRPQRLSF